MDWPATQALGTISLAVVPNDLSSFRVRYPPERIVADLQAMRSVKVLAIGETIIDQYVFCDAMGRTNKEAVLVVDRGPQFGLDPPQIYSQRAEIQGLHRLHGATLRTRARLHKTKAVMRTTATLCAGHLREQLMANPG